MNRSVQASETVTPGKWGVTVVRLVATAMA